MPFSDILTLLFIPFTAGAVGFVTNALAIKMLFRPYKAKWYTLGWQGVIPRTRKRLARAVAVNVGEKLLTPETVTSAVREEGEKFISSLLEQLSTEEFKKDKLLPFLETVFTPLDEYSQTINRALFKKIEAIELEELTEGAKSLARAFSSPALKQRIGQIIDGYLKSQLYLLSEGGRPLSELLPTLPVRGLAESIAEIFLPAFCEFTNLTETKKIVAEILIKYKKERFEGSFKDKVKGFAAELLMPDERIKSLVFESLPDIGEKIKKDAELKDKLIAFVEEKIKGYRFAKNGFAEKLIPQLAKEFGSAGALPITLELWESVKRTEWRTLGDMLKAGGVELNSAVPVKFSLKGFVLESTEDIVATLKKLLERGARGICEPLVEAAPLFFSLINVTKAVEDKINSLEQSEVEDMLFSFMREHFRWINIMGFVIGFFVGLIQLLVIHYR